MINIDIISKSDLVKMCNDPALFKLVNFKNEEVGKQFNNLTLNQLSDLRIITMEFCKKGKIEQIISIVRYYYYIILQKNHQYSQFVKNINEY